MKIVYFTHFDLLRPTTNRISDIRFCEGFAENGCEVEMVTPYVYRSYNIKRSDILTSYGIEHSFRITMLPTPFWKGMSKWINVPILTALVFLVYLRILLATWGRWSEVVVLSRDVNCLLPVLCVNRLLLRGGPQVVHWGHEIKEENPRYRWVYREADGVIGTNTAIVEDLAEAVGLPRERMAVTLNPVSTRQLEARLDKRQVRERLGLSMERPLIVYTGKVGVGNEEIEHILSAASCLPEYMFLFTGGKPGVVAHYRRYCEDRDLSNVCFTGFLDDYTEVMKYQVGADVLVSYYTSAHHLVDYNYPQKITEYMLSGNPIVTPDYRATRDVLNTGNAIFVEPEDPASLAAGIRRAVEDRELAQRVGDQAREDARQITFKHRTRLLMDFFDRCRERSLLPHMESVAAR